MSPLDAQVWGALYYVFSFALAMWGIAFAYAAVQAVRELMAIRKSK
jgi:hypothetical protein